MRSWRNCTAAALLEFSMIVSIIFLIGYACVDFSKIFNSFESMSSVSREAARSALVQCESNSDATACDPLTQNCFLMCLQQKQVFGRVRTFADNAIPGCEVIISAFDRVIVGGISQIVFAGQVGQVPDPVNPALLRTPALGQQSRVSLASIQANIGLNDSLLFDYSASVPTGPSKKRLTVGEVFCPTEAIAPNIFLFVPRRDILYEVTLF